MLPLPTFIYIVFRTFHCSSVPIKNDNIFQVSSCPNILQNDCHFLPWSVQRLKCLLHDAEPTAFRTRMLRVCFSHSRSADEEVASRPLNPFSQIISNAASLTRLRHTDPSISKRSQPAYHQYGQADLKPPTTVQQFITNVSSANKPSRSLLTLAVPTPGSSRKALPASIRPPTRLCPKKIATSAPAASRRLAAPSFLSRTNISISRMLAERSSTASSAMIP